MRRPRAPAAAHLRSQIPPPRTHAPRPTLPPHRIGQPCPYCLTSAALSAGILLSNATGFRPDEVQKQGTALSAVALSAVLLLAVPQTRAADRARAVDIPYKEPEARARPPAPPRREPRALTPRLARGEAPGR